MARKPSAPSMESISTVVRSTRADSIWLAMVRRQISSYSRARSPSSRTALGWRASEVGRIASWASWAFLALVL